MRRPATAAEAYEQTHGTKGVGASSQFSPEEGSGQMCYDALSQEVRAHMAMQPSDSKRVKGGRPTTPAGEGWWGTCSPVEGLTDLRVGDMLETILPSVL